MSRVTDTIPRLNPVFGLALPWPQGRRGPPTPSSPLLLPYKTLLSVYGHHLEGGLCNFGRRKRPIKEMRFSSIGALPLRVGSVSHACMKGTNNTLHSCLLMGLVLLCTLICFDFFLISHLLRPSCSILLPPHVPSSTHTTLPTTKYRLGNAPGHGAKNRNFFRSRSTPVCVTIEGGREEGVRTCWINLSCPLL